MQARRLRWEDACMVCKRSAPRADAMPPPPPPEPLAKAKAMGPLFPPMASTNFFARGRRAPRERFAFRFPLATGSPSQLP